MLSFYKTTMLAASIAWPIFTQAAEPGRHTPLRHIKAVKTDTTLTLLDSVKSDSYRKVYKYNEYGYVTSMKVYNNHGDGDWKLSTDESYEQTYAFDDNGQCTERVRYSLTENGQRDKVTSKGAIEREGEYTWERYWERDDLHGITYLSEAKGYDKWGNLSIHIDYEYDEELHSAHVSRYIEERFAGKLPPQNHHEYKLYKNALQTYSLEGYGYPGNDTIYVRSASKVVDEITGGMLERKRYNFYDSDYDGKRVKKDDLDSHWQRESTAQYGLNADETRPTSLLENGVIKATWQWDDKGRLVKHSDQHQTQTYTYADDYAAPVSLQQVISGMGGFYPEDSECIYGNMATFHSEDEYGYEDQKGEYDSQGRLVKVTWTEVDTDDNYTSKGTMTYGYRTDGHRAYMIDACPDEDSYIKEEYIYDSHGTWTGIIEYEGDSENGPWRKTYSSGFTAKRKGMRRAATKAPNLTEDMSDGRHSIETNEGIWAFTGWYIVENGEIVDGNYQTYPISDARRPQDPDLNYTDPAVPLCENDEDNIDNKESVGWYYTWDSNTKQWKEGHGPTYYQRTYKDGDLIKIDTYNSDREITSTWVFTFDDAGRLIKEGNAESYYEYTYLNDTDYLSTRYSSYYGEMRRYYYSQHGYADPTGIETPHINQTADEAYYDLQGRRITQPHQGIYIHKGQKVVIK